MAFGALPFTVSNSCGKDKMDIGKDEALSGIGNTLLLGRIAIANSKVAYCRFREILAQKPWQALAQQGARVQRLLCASTGTK